MRGEFLELEGHRLYCFAAGTRGVGDPVVFLHGLAGSSLLWREVVRRAPPGHRLVVLDLLGHGRSDLPAGADYAPAAHAARLGAALDELGIARAVLVGHHLGAATVLAAAVARPDRVAGLLLSAPSPHDAGAGVATGRRLAWLARHLPPTLVASWWHGTVARGYAEPDRTGHRAAERSLRPFRSREGRDALLAQLRALTPATWRAALVGIETLAVPVTVLAGARDPLVPVADARALAARIPGARLDIIADARHFLPEDAPDRMAGALHALLEQTR